MLYQISKDNSDTLFVFLSTVEQLKDGTTCILASLKEIIQFFHQ